ncbi:hypothetical protein EW146_g5195 [Bondarzewia mesenterica]|uniref:Uncharacterized protein n=1 Tax=Bondarzewia mesenterica TaxID=1095465 RepID=A0A4S4LU23_9AGAM|nr:hypothetical protein EW146_g5195 [Bondarzewia mesenterica]
MPPSTSPIPAKRALASKEASLFRELLNLYETRQLKKGQKAADQILKKFPEHGETLCMKGLILTHMGKREEGLELVRKGVRSDLTSHIVWHVFGLIQKGEKNYEEALKSYTQALRFDKENMNILRDAAHLQTQLRLFDALVETRHLLLKLRPNLRQNWIALAVAYHLNGNLVETKKVLEMYERTLKNVPDYDFEHSEILLYHVRVLEQLGKWSDALSLLDVSAKSRAIIDRVAIMETRARLLSKLDSEEDAEQAWRNVIQHNPENHGYYRGLLSSKHIELDDLTDVGRAQALQVLQDFSASIPRADAPKRLALTVASAEYPIGDKFKELVKTYILRGLKKGIPSLFADIKKLYQDPQKGQIIEEVSEGFRELQEGGGSVDDSPSSSTAPADLEEPTTYLWTLYFLAQHHSFLGRNSRALELLAVALKHTPTLPELHAFKGRVLKRLGDPFGASKCLDDARFLDGQDRFLNTKSAKYRLRAGLVDEASEVLGLFTKKDAQSPGADLEDMQSLLYLTEEGSAHYRSGKLHLALKRYHAVQKVFDEIEDDQFDFHGYSIRKFTINIYLDLISWEDRLRTHPKYISSALSASQIYVKVHDDPSIAKNCTSSGTLTEVEKKAKKKAKKAAQKIHDTQKAASLANEDKGLDVVPAKDDDPDGSKLLTGSDPLERAWKLLSPMITVAQGNIDVWIAVYDVAVRRGKYLQAVRALNFVKSLDAENSELHVRLLHFRRTYSSLSTPLPAAVDSLISNALSSLLPVETSSEAFNTAYLQRHPTDAQAVLASAKALRLLDSPRDEVENVVFSVLNPDVNLNIRTALQALDFLRDMLSPRVDEFRLACDKKF